LNRLAELRRFYAIVEDLERRAGVRRLSDCRGKMPWPVRGVYFFFEDGERRSASGSGPRVVRIGTHALKPGSSTTLWDRLSQHRGAVSTRGGNHRGSIFRLLVGEALLRRDGAWVPTWGVGRSKGEAVSACGVTRAALERLEAPVEASVSAVIGAMSVLCVDVPDDPGPGSLRGSIERNAIALLSNRGKDAIDDASPSWLGRHSGRELVRASGLWNVEHVEGQYDAAFLDVLAGCAPVPASEGSFRVSRSGGAGSRA
jgi:hypothetical protein